MLVGDAVSAGVGDPVASVGLEVNVWKDAVDQGVAVHPSVLGVDVATCLPLAVGSSTGDSDVVSGMKCGVVDVAMIGEGVQTGAGVAVRVTVDGGVPPAGCVLETVDVVPEGEKEEWY